MEGEGFILSNAVRGLCMLTEMAFESVWALILYHVYKAGDGLWIVSL